MDTNKQPLPRDERRPSPKAQKKQVVHLDLGSEYLRVSDKAPFAIQEAYKAIRTNLLFALSSQESKVVVVSSAQAGEGKSTTCCNLAITMAQTGARVLLIDADMRKPVQHKIFRKVNLRGLSNLLGGFYSLPEVLLSDVADNLDLIPSGTIPPNPSELLGSGNMKRLLEKMSESYDYVFVDSPPLNLVTDAALLASVSAGVVLVARQKTCTYDDLDRALESIQFAKANLLGVVINRTQERGKRGRAYKRSYQYEYKDK